MLILFMFLLIAAFIIAVMLRNRRMKKRNFFDYDLFIISIIIIVVLFIWNIGSILWTTNIVISIPALEKKIEMYQEENEKIEDTLSMLVENYKDWEKDTYKEFKSEEIAQFISLYPELSSDELVKAQINTYIDNAKELKRLQEKRIDKETYKWWLYFGKRNY